MGTARRWALVTVIGLVAGLTVIGTAGAATVTVEALGGTSGSFSPKDATVTAGDTVTWQNRGTALHNVTSIGATPAEDGQLFDRDFDQGRSTSVVLSTPGTVRYYCKFHGDRDGTGMAGSITVNGSTTAGRTTSRLSGQGRIQTAIAISKAAFPNGATEVYLSSQDVNPDALVGGALTKGPILLVPSCGTLPAEVAAEIRRLGATKVTALGGQKAVCDSILQQAGNA